MIDTITGFESIGPVTFRMNGNEANQITRAMGFVESDDTPESLERLAGEIRAKAEICETSIHLVKKATSVTMDGAATIDGPYCKIPKRRVGAGDRFNAGLFAGILLGLEPAERLTLGCANSGYFVRNAQSATWPQLTQFLKEWAANSHLE